jgi:hypothetical protein
MRKWISRIGAAHKGLLSRWRATGSLVWGASFGAILCFLCYLISLFWPPHIPFLFVPLEAGFVALILMLLDAGPGRESSFARAVQFGLFYAVPNFTRHGGSFSSSLTYIIVGSILYGVFMALIWRFYIYDPGKPLH